MKICAISDTHGKHRQIKNMPEADILIHAGDITNRGELSIMEDFADWMKELPYTSKICIHGNHEVGHESGPKRAPGLKMLEDAGIIYLQDSNIVIDGIKFHGSAVSPRFFDWEYNRNRGKDIAYHWSLIPDDVDILITHGPPKGILDNAPRGFGQFESVGCKDLLDRIMQLKNIKLHAFGHIHHDGSKKNVYNGIQFVNASICQENYQPINEPILIEI